MMLLLGGILLFFMCKCMNALQKEKKNTKNSEPTEAEHIDDETVRMHSSELSLNKKFEH